MESICDCLLWLVVRRKQFLVLLRIEFGSLCKTRMQNLFRVLARPSLSRMFLKPSLSYYMSVFLPPKPLSLEIETMLNKFWWSLNSNERKGLNQHSWNAMIMSKHKGGMRFRILYGFNLALLGKLSWNLIKNLDHQWLEFSRRVIIQILIF